MRKPASERKGQNVLNKRVIKQLKNSWINIKRAERPQQMEALVPFLAMASVLRSHLMVSSKIVPRYLYDGLSVKIPFDGVLKDRSEVFIPMDYFHLLPSLQHSLTRPD